MKKENLLQLTEKRINELGIYLAEFALEQVPREDDVNSYDANDLLSLFEKCYENFISYAETNGLFNSDEKKALIENKDELDCYITEQAIDAAREIITEEM
jgi:hypothetical protein